MSKYGCVCSAGFIHFDNALNFRRVKPKGTALPLFESVDLENYANVMFWALSETREKKFRNRDVVLIRYDIPGLALAEAVYSRLMDAHLMPVAVAMPTPYMEMER